MKKKVLIGGVALILLGAGLIALSGEFAPHPAPNPAAASLPLPPGHYTEHAPYYDIAANYATSTPLKGSANAAAIAAMQRFIAGEIVRFKKDGDFAGITPAEAAQMGLGAGRKETLQITYLIASSARTVSYIFTTYEDTLGAHGNLFFRTFTFDTTTGQELALSDLFQSGSDYLARLSGLARTQLPAIIGSGMVSTQMLDQGTTPEDKNFSNFFIDNGDLVILFAPYAVAPYAAGPQTLRIPLSSLSDILNPQYRPS